LAATAGPAHWTPWDAVTEVGPPVSTAPVVAVAGGPAFTFGYAEHAELLAAAGAQVVTVDPLRDNELPDRTAALVLPGGFPERHATGLAANTRLRESIARFARSGGIVQAECAGLLYLLDELAGEPMCGVLPGRAEMTARLTLGYRDAVVAADSVAHRTGERRTGHEFHHTRLVSDAPTAPAWHWRDNDDRPVSEGFVLGNTHASYLHTHPAGQPETVARLVDAAGGTR
jgi:cobyrinic acid a,c-diamide synthase